MTRTASRQSTVWRLAALLIAFAMMAAACGGSDASEGADEPTTAAPADDDSSEGGDEESEASAGEEEEVASEEVSEDTELHVFHFKVNIQTEWQTMTDEYSKQNPDVTFINEIIGGGSAWLPILKSKFAAGQGPDIFIVEGPSQAAEFADYLSDLTDEDWTTRAVPTALAGLTIDDKVMGMPVNLEGYGYIYNKEIFEEAGVTEPPGTLSELRAAAEKIAAAGYTPFGTGYGIWWVPGLHVMNLPFARQDDPQAFLDAALAGDIAMAEDPLFADLQALADLTVEFGEENPLTTDKDRQTLLFVNNEVAMIQQGNWREKEILEANPDAQIGLLPMPLGDGADADSLAVGVPFYFVVNSDSSPQQQAEAREFLNWMVSSDYGKKTLVEEFGFIPAYGDIEPVGLGGVSQDILSYSAEGKTIPWTFGQFPDGSAQEMSESFQKYVAGVSDWDEFLASVDETWTRLAE